MPPAGAQLPGQVAQVQAAHGGRKPKDEHARDSKAQRAGAVHHVATGVSEALHQGM
jgi:hypothetical protein